MPSNAFNASNPTKKPPAYCWFRKDPLPIMIPPMAWPRLQGWARWTDLAPIPAPTDIAIYTTMDRVGASWIWQNYVEKDGYRFWISLSRLANPQPWELELLLAYPWGGFEQTWWTPITIQLTPGWDTGPLEHITTPGVDFRQARVTQ